MKKSFNLDSMVRPNIRDLEPYHSARLDFEQGLLLDANENSLGSPFEDNDKLHRYPDPLQKELRKKIAEWRGVQPENVFVGVGSDEGIDLLYRIFCEPGQDRILTLPPTYGMYGVSARIHNITVDKVLLNKQFQPRVKDVLQAATPQTKLLLLCSPNNPTANVFDEEKITRLVKNFEGLVVIDEAYVDFSNGESWVSKLEEYSNLVILQTMSKSFGLAGVRMGITYASAEIISYMMKVKAPYNVNKLTSEAAIKAFGNMNKIESNIRAIKTERENLRARLEEITAVEKIYPSDSNFLLVKIQDALNIYQSLADRDIIVRYRGNEPLCSDCLRITVGTPEENQRLISALKDVTK